MQRFFADPSALREGSVFLTGEDARHISLSLRMKKGDPLSVCTPDGLQHDCILTDLAPDRVVCRVLRSAPCESEPPCRLRLFQALPKGDKPEIIVQKAVECGVTSVTFFESRYCVARFTDNREKKLERYNRIAAEAAKQCGRGILPRVGTLPSFDAVLAAAGALPLSLFCYENEGERLLGDILLADRSPELGIVVGAEGGFSPEEAQRAKEAGLVSVGLGKRILRCETASGFVLAGICTLKELTARKFN